MPDIFQYVDYREYLNAWFAEAKRKNAAFSFRMFSKMAGYNSPGFIKMVLSGERNLTVAGLHKFAKALKFGIREGHYFEAMVFYNQAKDDKERDIYYDRLCTLRPKAKLTGIEKDQYEFFTQRHFVFIREMAALPHFREDYAWISRHVIPPITPQQAEHAVNLLLRLEFLKRDESGRLAQSESTLTTPVEVESAELYHLHRSMLDLAKESLRTAHRDLRDITSLTIPLPLSALKEVKKKLLNFKMELADWVNKRGDDYHDVFQVSMQLFPVTDTKNPHKK